MGNYKFHTGFKSRLIVDQNKIFISMPLSQHHYVEKWNIVLQDNNWQNLSNIAVFFLFLHSSTYFKHTDYFIATWKCQSIQLPCPCFTLGVIVSRIPTPIHQANTSILVSVIHRIEFQKELKMVVVSMFFHVHSTWVLKTAVPKFSPNLQLFTIHSF